ncbi:type II toxin-antitoxin system HipA family toxin [Lujinxingia vulgaris]|nr:type II toxin-antitoxin system HipA family toxin [Lujinxingia vulgaris]
MNEAALWVYYEDRRVGRADLHDGDRLSFVYDSDWLAHGGAFALSQSLPLRERGFGPEVAHAFFENLLPEGGAREMIAAQLGISVENDVALLAALGEETAGAFRIVGAETQTKQRFANARVRRILTTSELERWADGEPVGWAEESGEPPRLSLAGAQHKMACIREGDHYVVPASHEASTHILKFDSLRFRHLSVNEFLTMRFAAALGLPVCHVDLDVGASTPFLVVERYDRRDLDGATVRLHQEDFCQVFALSRHRKYQSEGGPTLLEIGRRLGEVSTQAAKDLVNLLRWVMFNALSGNADGHAKNLSLLYGARGPCLAPFYDLVCTRAIEGVHTGLAMAVDGEVNADRLRPRHFEALAEGWDMRPALATRELERLLGQRKRAWETALAALHEHVEYSPAVERVERAMEQRARALENNLRQDRP